MKYNKLCGSRNRQVGAVWAEFLMVSSALVVTMFLLIPMLAKFMDIRHKSEQSAQYGSWERSVWYGSVGKDSSEKKTSNTILEEAKYRVLADGDTLIYTNQATEDFKVDSFHYFNDSKSGSSVYKPLLAKRGELPEDTLSEFSGSNGAHPNASLMKGATIIVRNTTDDFFKAVNKNGYYKSTYAMSVKQPSWFPAFSQDDISMKSSKALLVDGWGAGGNENMYGRVNELQSKAAGPFKFIIEGLRDTLVTITKPLTWVGIEMTSDIEGLDFDKVDSEQLFDESQQLGEYY